MSDDFEDVVALRFALFNIMTGVFVERALTAAIPDRFSPTAPFDGL